MQFQKDVLKKAEGASSHLKRIVGLLDQWTTAISGISTICSELAEEMVGFCSEDPYSTILASKYKEAALVMSHQSSILAKGTEYSFTAPVAECLGTYNSFMAKKAKWFAKSEEETRLARSVEDWYQGRFDALRMPFAHLIGFQSNYFQNMSATWNSVMALVEDRNLHNFADTTHKDILSSIEQIVATPLCLEHFRKFLEQDRATENINFIMDVNAFMAVHTGNRTSFEEFSSHAKKIYDRYISSSGEQQVNLDYEHVNHVSAKLASMMHAQERDENLFVECRRSIMGLLASGPLVRFRASPLGQELALTWRPCRLPTEETLRASAALPNPKLLSHSPSSHKSFLSILIPHSSPSTSPSPTPSQSPSPTPSLTSSAEFTPSTPPAEPPAHSMVALSASPPSPHLQPRKNRLPRSPSSPPVVAAPVQRSTSVHSMQQSATHSHVQSHAQYPPDAATTHTPLLTPTLHSPPSHSPLLTPAHALQPSAQHRVRIEKGPNNESTPVFFTSRTTVSGPKKTVSASSLTGMIPPSMFVSPTPPPRFEDNFSPKVVKIRRQTSVGTQIHSQFSFETIEKIFMSGDNPDMERTIFLAEGDKHPNGSDDVIDTASDVTHTSGRDGDCESDRSSDAELFDTGDTQLGEARSRSAHEHSAHAQDASSGSMRSRTAATRAFSEPHIDFGMRGTQRWKELVRSCEGLEFGNASASASSLSRASSIDSLAEEPNSEIFVGVVDEAAGEREEKEKREKEDRGVGDEVRGDGNGEGQEGIGIEVRTVADRGVEVGI